MKRSEGHLPRYKKTNNFIPYLEFPFDKACIKRAGGEARVQLCTQRPEMKTVLVLAAIVAIALGGAVPPSGRLDHVKTKPGKYYFIVNSTKKASYKL